MTRGRGSTGGPVFRTFRQDKRFPLQEDNVEATRGISEEERGAGGCLSSKWALYQHYRICCIRVGLLWFGYLVNTPVLAPAINWLS